MRPAFSTAAIYFPLEEYLGTIAHWNPGPTVILSGACIPGLEDVIAVVVAVELLAPKSVLKVLGFEWPL